MPGSRVRYEVVVPALLCLLVVSAGVRVSRAADQNKAATGKQDDVPIEITHADHLEYERTNGIWRATGGVVIHRGDEEMRADRVVFNTQTEDADAYGHVTFTKAGRVWRGETLHYNFGSKQWASGPFEAFVAPFYLRAARSYKVSDVEYVFEDADLTTCTNGFDDVHYSTHLNKVSVIPNDRMKGRNEVVYFGGYPAFYWPFWYHSLKDNDSGWSVEPGYSSSMGAELLTAYSYRFNPHLKSITDFDYRTARGFAGGEELRWRGDRSLAGAVSAYVLDDMDAKNELDENGQPLDSLRYRIKFEDRQELDQRTYLMAQATYLSDNQVLQDFFSHDYRNSFEPDNFASVTRREDNYTADLLLRTRLNDFFTQVQRLPEAAVSFQRQEIPGTPLFYEGRSSAAYLQQQWADSASNTDYSAVRIDSANTLYYPTKQFGFLSFIPRAGYEATFYSKTIASTSTVVNANGKTNLVVDSGPGDLRSVVNLGFEASFPAFRVWDDVKTDTLDQLRHVVEPYTRYTFVPTPNLRPDDLYQFDNVDTIDKENDVQLGVRNKLQTKRDGHPFDLVDLDTYTTYNISRRSGQEAFGDLTSKAYLRCVKWMDVNFDTDINMQDGHFDDFNTQIWLRDFGAWQAHMEYRYARGQTSLLMPDLTFTPNREWSFNEYTRYDADNARVQEQTVSVQRSFDCLVWRLQFAYLPSYTDNVGVDHKTDLKVFAEIWLTAFPNLKIGSENRN